MEFDFSACKTKQELEVAVYSAVQELISAIREACDISVDLACYIIHHLCVSTLENRLDAAFSETY